MAVRQGVCHLIDVLGRLPLVESAMGLLLQALVKLPLRSKLQNQVDSALVVKVTKQSEDVRVPQVGLDLYFPSDKYSNL